jgi:hypothetical protein
MIKKALVEVLLALLGALKEIIGSKTFLLAMINAAATLGAKYGLDLNVEQLAAVVGPLWLAQFAQAGKDLGKGAAQIRADALKDAAGVPQNPS